MEEGEENSHYLT